MLHSVKTKQQEELTHFEEQTAELQVRLNEQGRILRKQNVLVTKAQHSVLCFTVFAWWRRICSSSRDVGCSSSAGGGGGARTVSGGVCPPVLLRGLKKGGKTAQLGLLRFCYYVWIFGIREKKYEAALKLATTSLQKENSELIEVLHSTEVQLQQVLVSERSLEGELKKKESRLAKAEQAMLSQRVDLSQSLEKIQDLEQNLERAKRPVSPRVLAITGCMGAVDDGPAHPEIHRAGAVPVAPGGPRTFPSGERAGISSSVGGMSGGMMSVEGSRRSQDQGAGSSVRSVGGGSFAHAPLPTGTTSVVDRSGSGGGARSNDVSRSADPLLLKLKMVDGGGDIRIDGGPASSIAAVVSSSEKDHACSEEHNIKTMRLLTETDVDGKGREEGLPLVAAVEQVAPVLPLTSSTTTPSRE